MNDDCVFFVTVGDSAATFRAAASVESQAVAAVAAWEVPGLALEDGPVGLEGWDGDLRVPIGMGEGKAILNSLCKFVPARLFFVATEILRLMGDAKTDVDYVVGEEIVFPRDDFEDLVPANGPYWGCDRGISETYLRVIELDCGAAFGGERGHSGEEGIEPLEHDS